MSYDVYVGQSSENYTSNLYKFFQDFDAYPPSWNGMNASEVGDAIDSTLNSITVNAVDSLAVIYDAPNGWGSVATALDFLKRVRNACRDHPTDVVEVSW